jgi:hypothetical protein
MTTKGTTLQRIQVQRDVIKNARLKIGRAEATIVGIQSRCRHTWKIRRQVRQEGSRYYVIHEHCPLCDSRRERDTTVPECPQCGRQVLANDVCTDNHKVVGIIHDAESDDQ